MSDSDQHDEQRVPPKEGAAWGEAKRRVADRNAEARKEGKKQREAHDRQVADLRRAGSAIGTPKETYR